MNTNKQYILIIDGPMGGGKTTIAEILKTKLHGTLFTGLDRVKWLVSEFSRSKDENAAVAHMVQAMSRAALEDGMNVCIEQGFMKSKYLTPYLDMAKEFNIDIHIFQIEAPRDVLMKRIKGRSTPFFAKEPLTTVKIEQNLDNYFDNKYRKAEVINSSGIAPQEIVRVILEDLGAK